MTPMTRSNPTDDQTIVQLLDGSYSILSDSVTLKSYTVSMGEYGWECECPGYAFRKTCKHIPRVIAFDAKWIAERVKARMASVPPPPVNNRPKLQLEDLWADD